MRAVTVTNMVLFLVFIVNSDYFSNRSKIVKYFFLFHQIFFPWWHVTVNHLSEMCLRSPVCWSWVTADITDHDQSVSGRSGQWSVSCWHESAVVMFLQCLPLLLWCWPGHGSAPVVQHWRVSWPLCSQHHWSHLLHGPPGQRSYIPEHKEIIINTNHN